MNGSTSIRRAALANALALADTIIFPAFVSAHDSARIEARGSTSLPSTSPNSKKPNPASLSSLLSQTQIPPAYEPTPMKSCLPVFEPLMGLVFSRKTAPPD